MTAQTFKSLAVGIAAGIAVMPCSADDFGSGPQSGDFCADLKAIIAAAPTKFESIRGALWDHPFSVGSYVRPRPLSGAKAFMEGGAACAVQIHESLEGGAIYSCTFWPSDFPSPTLAESAHGLAERVAGCLDMGVPPVDNDSLGRRHFVLDSARISVVAARGPHGEQWLAVSVYPAD
jgi:hypothetical protein